MREEVIGILRKEVLRSSPIMNDMDREARTLSGSAMGKVNGLAFVRRVLNS